MSAHLHDHDAHPELNAFLSSIDTDRLCAAASVLRPGVDCSLGGKILGGYNVLFEIVFTDGITWLARCPLPYNCSSMDACDHLMHCYATALKYMKLHTSIPVPDVFACRSGSSKENDIGVSYMLMERMPGRPLDIQDIEEGEEAYEAAYTAAEKVFRQLAGFIMQFASLQFDKIGCLQEQPAGSGAFYVGEYFDAGISFPEARGQIYEASSYKGPFSTVSEFHSTLLSLNENFAAVDEDDDDGAYLRSVQQCRLIQPKVSLPQSENGPFVLNHDDLSSANVLVDDDYNITGILDFAGTIVPLPALCVYPAIFRENWISPFTDRELWLRCFLDAQPVPGSALNDVEVRKLLMEGALGRGTFYSALSQAYAYLAISPLAKELGIEEDVHETGVKTQT